MINKKTIFELVQEGPVDVITFGGQGTDWRQTLTQMWEDPRLASYFDELLERSDQILEPVAATVAICAPHARKALRAELLSAVGVAVSMPAVLLCQFGALLELHLAGVTLRSKEVLGHSQGILVKEFPQAIAAGEWEVCAKYLALARLIGAGVDKAGRENNLGPSKNGRPMLAILGMKQQDLESVLTEKTGNGYFEEVNIAVKNGPEAFVVSGRSSELEILQQHLQDEARVKTQFLDVDVPFHSPLLEQAYENISCWAKKCGLSGAEIAQILVTPVDWEKQVAQVRTRGAKYFVDLGPGDTVAKITARLLRGQGVSVISLGTADARDDMAHTQIPISTDYAQFMPKLRVLENGKETVDTAFTRLTGRSPILLAGMTPTTVDPHIVAAAANAGHWAELAGGGQVTEEVFAKNLAKLQAELEPGNAAQFNSMFFDRYLWNLQFGTQRIVSRARLGGAPLDGVVISAGIPTLEEARELITTLHGEGFKYVAFKPGTVETIEQVLAIAREVAPTPIIIQVEDGHAGGHHSWEDLEDLLLATYDQIRATKNVVLCVGGGIGTGQRAAEFVTGSWSVNRGLVAMPVDGVLVGTAAMTCKEALTSPDVKKLLVQTEGIKSGWVRPGENRGGMTSGLSHLRADMYEIDNDAAACGRLIAQVESDIEVIKSRREEIISALGKTAKPYFGDLENMTYEQWARRFAELIFPVTDPTWTLRFHKLLQRIEARVSERDHGLIETIFPNVDDAQSIVAVDALIAAYPQATLVKVTPTDAAWFPGLCRSYPKPLPFVPALDGDLLRWWGQDGLWQAQDSRYCAAQVRIIPGPISVGGIDRIDEPVGELLNRFEATCVSQLKAAGYCPTPALTRLGETTQELTQMREVITKSAFISWVGHHIPNPLLALEPANWKLEAVGKDQWNVQITFDTCWDGLANSEQYAVKNLTIPLDTSGCKFGAVPVVSEKRLPDSVYALLNGVAGVSSTMITGDLVRELPRLEKTKQHPFGQVRWEFTFTEELQTTHAAVTASPGGTSVVPDALLGPCWPAIYTALGSAKYEGYPVIEGLLNAVHLDHVIEKLGGIPCAEGQKIKVIAATTALEESSAGRIVTVEVFLQADGRRFLRFVERFAIRGRATSLNAPVEPPKFGATKKRIIDTPRSTLMRAQIKAPADMTPFAIVSGDYNPIHTSHMAAKLAGMQAPLVHGMWLSAAAQHLTLSALSGEENALLGWTYNMYGPVDLEKQVDIQIERVGRVAGGGLALEITCQIAGNTVSRATATSAAPKTAYIYPGQGIQKTGMGLDLIAKSNAAREIWERADAHTRTVLGFSILAVVRENPVEIFANKQWYRHENGVLNLTQFTQVALATLAFAQTAKLKEDGAFVENAIFAGHSLGEYNALAACAGIFPLETVLEIVFHRGSAMHNLVPRDDQGCSNYQMGALRPDQIGLDDKQVIDYVSKVSAASGEFLQIVNFNLADSQYGVAGTKAGLAALGQDAQLRATKLGGKSPFMLVPGIDVPFHSQVLQGGVQAFKEKLCQLLPPRIDSEILAGRYIPNLVARPFELSREFAQAIVEVAPSQELTALLETEAMWKNALADPQKLTRTLLIELLAWQFASPVRWIQTQEWFLPKVSQVVEVGLAASPVLANLAERTNKKLRPVGNTARIFNFERDENLVLNIEVNTIVDTENTEPSQSSTTSELKYPEKIVKQQKPLKTQVLVSTKDSCAESAVGPVADISFTASDALKVLIGHSTRLNLEDIGDSDTTETLTNGVSSRRNQLLMDMNTELGLAAIDGAAEADMKTLSEAVEKVGSHYKAYGPVLGEAIGDTVRKIFGPVGAKQNFINEYLQNTWGMGDGWAAHVGAQILLSTRQGMSPRGTELEQLSAQISSKSQLEALIDGAVQLLAERKKLMVSKIKRTDNAANVVDSAALEDYSQSISGPNGALVKTAQTLLGALNHHQQEAAGTVNSGVNAEAIRNSELAQTVSRELGTDWQKLVAPAFAPHRAVLLDDRWASAREDLARGALSDTKPVGNFWGTGKAVHEQAKWWATKVVDSLRADFLEIAEQALSEELGEYEEQVAVVTGFAPNSIAAEVTAQLLAGGATVIATSSQVNTKRLGFAKDLYRKNARGGAALWLVPANLNAFTDVDALAHWVGKAHVETVGGSAKEIRPALVPTLLFPFAAPRVQGTLADAGSQSEAQFRLLVWSVERLIGKLALIGADRAVEQRMHVVLPGSPNRGIFGGDGAYGEAKSAFDAIVKRWEKEKLWAARTTLVHPQIGWVRGTGLMGGNDGLVQAVQAQGIRTWSTSEIAAELLKLCTSESRIQAQSQPIVKDLTGGLADTELDLNALRTQSSGTVKRPTAEDSKIFALPTPLSPKLARLEKWKPTVASLTDTVVIVGIGEVSTWGSGRTRLQAELGITPDGEVDLTAAGVLELAWMCGLLTWRQTPVPGWYDKDETLVAEEKIYERFRDEVVARCGVRTFVDDGSLVSLASEEDPAVYLDKDISFTVKDEEQARSFVEADPTFTSAHLVAGEWTVLRRAGALVRVPRRAALSRTIGGQFPTDFDPAKWGIPATMLESLDRMAVWNLVTAVDAFISAGFSPAELLAAVHPSEVASTQGTGFGGMSSMRKLFVDRFLGEDRPSDVLQETLPNVIAAHTMQSLIGGYGSMIHPVGACATAAVSVEEGVDKIRCGKAEFVVAGAVDDISVESLVGFGDMNATARSSDLLERGISERFVSRSGDRRRAGFVEAQGGGTVLLARADLAARMGLPVYGVVAFAQSFADGIHTSIPAPGIGVLAAARGGKNSPLAQALAAYGADINDVCVVSKHDTSTNANDPNEAWLHSRLGRALGREAGNPLFVISQKSLTGHAKGGAAAFQIAGLCDVFSTGIIGPNASLDCVDREMATSGELCWVRSALEIGSPKAAFLTSLGFGHVSALIALVHPEAFVQILIREFGAESAKCWQVRAQQRIEAGAAHLAGAMVGKRQLFVAITDRRLGPAGEGRDLREVESAMLLDENARLGEGGVY